jgi:hypothetical protein
MMVGVMRDKLEVAARSNQNNEDESLRADLLVSHVCGERYQKLTDGERQALKDVGIMIKQYWACINPYIDDELVALFNDKNSAEVYIKGLQTLKVVPYELQVKYSRKSG